MTPLDVNARLIFLSFWPEEAEEMFEQPGKYRQDRPRLSKFVRLITE
jgi:hypothetical protein